jgi:hypothetical protein
MGQDRAQAYSMTQEAQRAALAAVRPRNLTEGEDINISLLEHVSPTEWESVILDPNVRISSQSFSPVFLLQDVPAQLIVYADLFFAC